ncbi:uncharacterized protein LOC105661846 isoform X2 [Megachile rotundata]|uniref:uncharacterized protein LOC105661846 isoform X2 n=1 Tax=Megachile rotundata TaxID=143995 RepID=UPI003FCFB6C9
MQMKLNTLRILIFLFIFQKESKATNCYQCDSKKDTNCTVDKVDIKYLQMCPESKPFCRKAVYIYYFMDSRQDLTVRECAKWRNADNECYRGRYTRDSYQLVCECKGAGCNRSTRYSSEATIFLYVFCPMIILFVLNPT